MQQKHRRQFPRGETPSAPPVRALSGEIYLSVYYLETAENQRA